MSNSTITDEPADIEVAWSHTTADSTRGLEMTREADTGQRAKLAGELDIVAVERLRVAYRIAPLASGRYRLTGTIEADVVQSCVVTLEPVPATIVDRIEVEFWPATEMPPAPATAAEAELPILDAEEHEPIENHRIAVGRIIKETLAAALPSYPRSPGAALEQNEAGPAEAGATNPFAALAGWKPKPE